MSLRSPMKVATVVGARPEFIKSAPISRAFVEWGVSEVLIHTGQHYDQVLSAVFFEEMALRPPDYELTAGSGLHGAQTARMLESIEQVLVDECPDWVVVYGDTNSTLAGALAACKLKLPVAHIEAGLRSFNRSMPEETNRVLTDHMAELLFAPTTTAVANLREEGIREAYIRLVGDVNYDALLLYAPRAEQESTIVGALGLVGGSFALVTLHRAENTENGDRLAILVEALCELAAELPVVWPLHPRTRAALDREGLRKGVEGSLRLIEPVGYLDMLMLERNARLIATDSGGVQKEAFFCRVPCVTLRDETEWTELIELGWNRLAPPMSAAWVAGVLREALVAGPGSSGDPYGGGNSAELIVRGLVDG